MLCISFESKVLLGVRPEQEGDDCTLALTYDDGAGAGEWSPWVG